MAHFAKVENGVVTDLIVVANEDCAGGDFPESESSGRQFIAALAVNDPRLEGQWFQTSYNTWNGLHFDGPKQGSVVDGVFVPSNGDPSRAFRWTFGQIGFTFDPSVGEHGEFHSSEEYA